MKTNDKITPRDIAAYERGQKRLRDIANSRPILNPNGPTALVPAWTKAERDAINQRQLNAKFGNS